MRGPSPALRFLGLLVLLAWPGALFGSDPFSTCERLIEQHPKELESYRCYWKIARNAKLGSEAVQRLERQLERHPDEPRILLYLGAIEGDRGNPRAEALLLRAADLFSQEGEATGEVYARLSVAFRMEQSGRFEDAGLELERAVQAAEGSGDRELTARATYGQASHEYGLGRFSRALSLGLRVKAIVVPDGPIDLREGTYNLLGNIRWALGLRDVAASDFREAARVARAMNDRYLESSERFNALFLERELAEERGAIPESLREEAEEVLLFANGAGNRPVETSALILLGKISEGEEKEAHFRRALQLAHRTGAVREADEINWLLAYHRAWLHPEQAPRLIREVQKLAAEARERGDRANQAEGLMHAARLAWFFGSPDEAFGISRSALESIELLRRLQSSSQIRSLALSRYANFYREVAGLLLGLPLGALTESARIQLAVDVLERARARSLYESLTLSDPEPVEEEMRPVLAGIDDVQRRLQLSRLDSTDRTELLTELDRLEAEEFRLRERSSRFTVGGLALPQVNVGALQKLLRNDEALLSFQLADPVEELDDRKEPKLQEPGCWSLLVTRELVRPFRLGSKRELLGAVDLFQGLIAREDGSEVEAARQLYRRLLSRTLSELRTGVSRLLLIPEPELELLPFETLRDAQGDPLAGRFEVERYPSLATFALLRTRPPRSYPAAALALADPALPTESEEATNGPVLRGFLGSRLELGRLPHARREGLQITRLLSSGSELRAGEEATESFLKSEDLSRYSILHLATHALVDESAPQRSSLLLAAGGGEDGLLQLRDLRTLDLEGKVVVLGACSSSSGRLVRGEGVQSLARGFLASGAAAVVSSLYPLRDDLTSALFEIFYEELNCGRSVGEALQRTQLELLRKGAPARLWSGVVLLGDGRIVPLAGREGAWLGHLPILLLGGVVLLFLLLSTHLFRRLRR